MTEGMRDDSPAIAAAWPLWQAMLAIMPRHTSWREGRDGGISPEEAVLREMATMQ